MIIDGVKKADTRTVVLNEFFEQPTVVVIKMLGPYAKAQIREVLMSGFNIGEMDAKGKTASVQTRNEGSAEREIKIRDLKLAHGFASTDMKAGGVVPEWNKALWDALDEADPRILEKVIAAVDDFSKIIEGGDTDPT